MSKHWIKFILIFVVLGSNIACDQVTKDYANRELKHDMEHSYLNDTFRLTFAENEGAFLSIGSDFSGPVRMILLIILPTLLMVGLLLYTLFSKENTLLQVFALSCILAGGMSNLFDRILYGKVVDFMNMGIGSVRTGIFNFADVAVMLGIGLLLYTNYKASKVTTPSSPST